MLFVHRRGTTVDKFSRIYAWIVVVAAAALIAALAASRHLHWTTALTFLAVACVLCEWRVIRLPRGGALTLSVVPLTLALLLRSGAETTPMEHAVGALQVIAIGSLIGYGASHRPPLLRLGFYVSHHVLSAALAGAAFVLLSRHLPYWLLERVHVLALIGYLIVLSGASMLLTGPINRRTLRGDRLPVTELAYTPFMVPIALIVFYFAETRESSALALITLILPLVGVLLTFTLYVNIDTTYGEVNQLYRISQELFAAMSRDETVLKVSQSIAHALSELIARVDTCLLYSRNPDANEYLLANQEQGADLPRTVLPGQGVLGRAALVATGTLIRDIAREDGRTPQERALPPKTTLLIHPLFAEQRTVGLLVLVRTGRPFSAEEYRLVSIVANQAGVTLHNAQMFEQSQLLADTDLQLGILNQVAFTQQSERMVGRARLRNQPVAVLLGDIDDFRHVNNTYGHQVGDTVLAGVADVLRTTVGASGIVGRWGGEEFVLSLPDADETYALWVAEEIRQRVAAQAFYSDDNQAFHVTISIGVALFPRDAGDFIALHKQADRAAYLAKRTGKNQVCLYEDRKALIEGATPAPVRVEGYVRGEEGQS